MEGPGPDKAKVKRNVQRMIAAGASQDEVDAYVEDALKTAVAPQAAHTSQTAAPSAVDEGDPGYGERLATHVLNTAQGIPGVEAVEAGAGMLGSNRQRILDLLRMKMGIDPKFQSDDAPLTYKQSLDALRGMTGKIPAGLRVAEQAVGSMAVPVPKGWSAAKSGGVYGATSQALAADPIKDGTDLAMRAGKTALGGFIGNKAGKYIERGATALRGLKTPRYDEALIGQLRDRTNSARQLYASGMQEGRGKEATEAIQRFLGEEDIAPIVEELRQSPSMQGKELPDLLDALFKELSDQHGLVTKRLAQANPSRPNIQGRVRGADIQLQKDRLLTAMETPDVNVAPSQSAPSVQHRLERQLQTTETPALMPSYRTAVEDFAARSKRLEDLRRGYQTQRVNMGTSTPADRNVTKYSPAAFSDWAGSATPQALDDATSGILGNVSQGEGQYGRSLDVAAKLLRRKGTRGENALTGLIRGGTFAAPISVQELFRSFAGGAQ